MAERVEHRLRGFMLALAALAFVTTPAELVLVEHYGDWVQVIPFVLSGAGLLAIVALRVWPRRGTVLALRGVAVVTVVGSLYGIYAHVESNVGFELEIRPGAALRDVVFDALGGVSPLFAPAVLAFAALVALVATYRHPALTAASEAPERQPPRPR